MNLRVNQLAAGWAKKLADADGEAQRAPVYEYALLGLLTFGTSIFLLAVLAFIFGKGPELLFFLLGFFPSRTLWGGYHAPQAGWCIVLSTLHGGLGLLFIPFAAAHALAWLLFAGLTGSVCVYAFAPVAHKNKAQNPARRRRLRALGLLCLLLNLLLIWLCFQFAFFTAAAGLMFGLFSAALLCALGHFFNPQA